MKLSRLNAVCWVLVWIWVWVRGPGGGGGGGGGLRILLNPSSFETLATSRGEQFTPGHWSSGETRVMDEITTWINDDGVTVEYFYFIIRVCTCESVDGP